MSPNKMFLLWKSMTHKKEMLEEKTKLCIQCPEGWMPETWEEKFAEREKERERETKTKKIRDENHWEKSCIHGNISKEEWEGGEIMGIMERCWTRGVHWTSKSSSNDK